MPLVTSSIVRNVTFSEDFPPFLIPLFHEAWRIVRFVGTAASVEATTFLSTTPPNHVRARVHAWFGRPNAAARRVLGTNIQRLVGALEQRQVVFIWDRGQGNQGIAYVLIADMGSAGPIHIYVPASIWIYILGSSHMAGMMARQLVSTLYHELSHFVLLTGHMAGEPKATEGEAVARRLATTPNAATLTVLNADSYGYYFDSFIKDDARQILAAAGAEVTKGFKAQRLQHEAIIKDAKDAKDAKRAHHARDAKGGHDAGATAAAGTGGAAGAGAGDTKP